MLFLFWQVCSTPTVVPRREPGHMWTEGAKPMSQAVRRVPVSGAWRILLIVLRSNPPLSIWILSSTFRPWGWGLPRPPRASWTVETTKAAQGTIIPTPLKLRTQAIDFPIDYCRENRYNGLWAQKISAVWGWFLTGTPYIGPGGLPPPRPALCFCYLVAHYSLCWKINQGFLTRFALASRDFLLQNPPRGRAWPDGDG